MIRWGRIYTMSIVLLLGMWGPQGLISADIAHDSAVEVDNDITMPPSNLRLLNHVTNPRQILLMAWDPCITFYFFHGPNFRRRAGAYRLGWVLD